MVFRESETEALSPWAQNELDLCQAVPSREDNPRACARLSILSLFHREQTG